MVGESSVLVAVGYDGVKNTCSISLTKITFVACSEVNVKFVLRSPTTFTHRRVVSETYVRDRVLNIALVNVCLILPTR